MTTRPKRMPDSAFFSIVPTLPNWTTLFTLRITAIHSFSLLVDFFWNRYPLRPLKVSVARPSCQVFYQALRFAMMHRNTKCFHMGCGMRVTIVLRKPCWCRSHRILNSAMPCDTRLLAVELTPWNRDRRVNTCFRSSLLDANPLQRRKTSLKRTLNIISL